MIVKQEVEVAKECADVLDMLVVIVKDIKLKKSVAEIASDALPKLMAAIDGVSGIPAEIVEKEAFDRTIGLKLGEIAAALQA